MAGASPRQLFYWKLPRVLSPAEERAIDARLEAAEKNGTYEQAIELDINQKSDDRPVVILRREGVNVLVGMCTRQDYTDKGAVRIDPDDVLPRGAMTDVSYFRPDRIWTDHVDWHRRFMGTLARDKFEEVRQAAANFILGRA